MCKREPAQENEMHKIRHGFSDINASPIPARGEDLIQINQKKRPYYLEALLFRQWAE